MKNCLPIYEPVSWDIGNGNWLFFDIFISDDDSIIAIGAYEPATKAKSGIDYQHIECKVGNITIRGKVVKDPHNHTLIIRFRSKELAILIKQNKEVSVQITAGKMHRRFLLTKPGNTGKGRLCLSTLQKNEYDYITTWIEYHQKVGVSHFYIYDNASDDFERLVDLLRPYIEKDLVTLVKWNFPKWSKEWKNSESGQTAQQNHSLYRFCNEWMIGLPDIDEYIFPLNKAADDLLKYLHFISRLNKVMLGIFAGISIRTIWFGCNNGINYNYQDFLDKLTMRKAKPEPRKQREKCIVYPKKVKVFSIHRVLRGKLVKHVSPKTLRINHYYTLSKRMCDHMIYDQVFDDGIQKLSGKCY